jgi:hypothetical protein
MKITRLLLSALIIISPLTQAADKNPAAAPDRSGAAKFTGPLSGFEGRNDWQADGMITVEVLNLTVASN